MALELKKCPLCGGEINAAAKRCIHCREWITPEALAERERKMKEQQELQRIAQEQREAFEREERELREAEEAARREAEEAAEAARREQEAQAARQAEEERLQREAAERAAAQQALEAEAAADSANFATAEPSDPFGAVYDSDGPGVPPPFTGGDEGPQTPPSYGGTVPPPSAPQEKQSFFNKYFIGTFFRNYANFSGSASRKEYWLSTLANVLVALIVIFLPAGLAMLFPHVSNEEGLGVMAVSGILYAAVLFIPGLALAMRRLHDSGRSGAWYLINFVPYIGGIWFFVLMLMPSLERHEDSGSRFKAVDWIVLLLAIAAVPMFAYGHAEAHDRSYRNLYDYDSYDTYSEDSEVPVEAVEEEVVWEEPAVEEVAIDSVAAPAEDYYYDSEVW